MSLPSFPHPRSVRAQQPQRFRASRFPTSTLKLLRCENIRLGVLRWTSLIVCYTIFCNAPALRQYFYAQYNGDISTPNPRAVALIGGALRLAFHDAAEYSPATFGVSDWYRSDGCINTADPGNGGIAAAIALLDIAWTNL